jgi:glycosyltransferase involved in cell wall biosynthesis
MEKLLTIVIPTWNRSQRLVEQLDEISRAVALLGSETAVRIKVAISDNASDDDVAAIVSGRGYNAFALHIGRNLVNVGCDANYLRALEMADSEWVWMIGDDDDVCWENFGDIIRLITNTTLDVILLCESGLCEQRSRIESIEGFVSGCTLAEWSSFFKLGRLICRASALRSYLPIAWMRGVGHWHSYVIPSARLMLEKGVYINYGHWIKEDCRPRRWDLLRGHVGAWETALIAFGGISCGSRGINKIERRLRGKSIARAYIIDLSKKKTGTSSVSLYWMVFHVGVIFSFLCCGAAIFRKCVGENVYSFVLGVFLVRVNSAGEDKY